jgi:hypothetical protein
VPERLIALLIDARLMGGRLIAREVGFSLVERRLKRARVDREQELTVAKAWAAPMACNWFGTVFCTALAASTATGGNCLGALPLSPPRLHPISAPKQSRAIRPAGLRGLDISGDLSRP